MRIRPTSPNLELSLRACTKAASRLSEPVSARPRRTPPATRAATARTTTEIRSGRRRFLSVLSLEGRSLDRHRAAGQCARPAQPPSRRSPGSTFESKTRHRSRARRKPEHDRANSASGLAGSLRTTGIACQRARSARGKLYANDSQHTMRDISALHEQHTSSHAVDDVAPATIGSVSGAFP
jgi:hypothetical protein